MRKARPKAQPKQAHAPSRPRSRRRIVPSFHFGSRLLIIVFASAAFLMLLAAVLPLAVPTSAYRSWVEGEVSRYADARVSIDRFRFQLLPYPGYTITGLALVSKSAPFQGQPFLQADKVRGSISFLSLMAGRVVTAVSAGGVTLDYRKSGGVSNLGALLNLSEGLAGSPPAFGASFEGPAPSSPSPALVPGAQIKTLQALPEEKAPAPVAPPATPEEGVKQTPQGPTTEPAGEKNSRLGLIREAHAQEAGEFPADEGSIEISSIDVSHGRINVWEDGAQIYSVDGLRLSAGRVLSSGGLGANLRAAGKLAGLKSGAQAVSADVGISGQLFVDPSRREVGARAMRVSVSGSQAVVDFSVNYGASPVSFDIHFATPDLSPRAAAPILAAAGMSFPEGLTWDGPVAADLSFKGTSEAIDLVANIEAATARIGFADFFSKGAGLPLRASLSLFFTPTAIALRDGQLTIGQENFLVKGGLDRVGESILRLSVSGANLDASVLKTFFPKMSFIDALEDLELSFDLEGAPYSPAPFGVRGKFKGKRASVAGFEIEEVEGALERVGTVDVPSGAAVPFTVPTLRGRYAGGELSGNGSVSLGASTDLNFETVVSRADSSLIPALGGVIAGEASIVASLASTGSGSVELSQNAKLSGSILLSEGSWKEIRIGEQLFTPEIWKKFEEASGVVLDQAGKEKLRSLAGEIRDAKVSFESAAGRDEIGELSWSQGPLEFKAKGTCEAGALALDGDMFVEKGFSALLVAAPASRKALFDADGRLIFPIRLAGKAASPEISIDADKMLALLKEKKAVAPPAAPPASAAKPAAPPASAAKPAAPAAAKPKAPAAAGPAPQAKAPVQQGTPAAEAPSTKKKPILTPDKKGARSSAPPTEEQVDDILKVIIGH